MTASIYNTNSGIAFVLAGDIAYGINVGAGWCVVEGAPAEILQAVGPDKDGDMEVEILTAGQWQPVLAAYGDLL